MGYNLPELKAVADNLNGLLGQAVPLSEAKDAPSWDELGCTYASLCINDKNQEVAAILADLPAAIALAGRMLMLPQGALDEHAAAPKLDESMLDALSEIFNNLTKALNRVAGNPHIRSAAARQTSDVAPSASWLGEVKARRDFVTPGVGAVASGRLVVVAR
ncbi:MAG: hypothetical protein H6836_01500 [Planctomycetes bacterium]|nr:hypothetical protein [Planctomycetota bacterium]MCB9888220.1 hypothetical protein [Planctomycetota bacterium]